MRAHATRQVRGDNADISLLARPLSDGSGVTGSPCARLLPCLAWHDSTHLASANFYRALFASERGVLGFIESTLGPRQAADVVELGLANFVSKWRTWVLDDGVVAAMVGHLDGSAVRPALEALEEAHGSAAGRRWRPGSWS
jgi:hypothetical protein